MLNPWRKNLYSYKNPFSFNPITADDLNEKQSEGIFLKDRMGDETWLRRAPKFLDDPDGCGLFPPLGDMTCIYRQPFVLSVKDVKLVGVRTYLDKKRNWFNDQGYVETFESDLAKLAQYQNLFLNEWTGFRPTDKADRFIFESGNRSEVSLGGRTLAICGLEPDNYGSWLFRVLPKIHTSLSLGLKFDRILIEARHPRLHEYLDMIGVDRSMIVQHDRNYIYRLEHALIPSLQNAHAYLDVPTQKFYAQLRSRYGSPCKGEKIYISRMNHARSGYTTRILLNEDKLIESLSKEGFKIVCPELLTLKEQIETFSSASMVVGPSGSAMFNVVFCHPKTKLIDIESEPHWIHAHLSLFSSLDLDFGIFVGKIDTTDPNPVHKKWSVNIPALISRIQSMALNNN